ncbi:MAG: hypothetical protein HY303_09500 [Candidatus Wallbacteria bacterium]|nr:hypothetical protein [Candidatus Wallbacteria bacterium]
MNVKHRVLIYPEGPASAQLLEAWLKPFHCVTSVARKNKQDLRLAAGGRSADFVVYYESRDDDYDWSFLSELAGVFAGATILVVLADETLEAPARRALGLSLPNLVCLLVEPTLPVVDLAIRLLIEPASVEQAQAVRTMAAAADDRAGLEGPLEFSAVQHTEHCQSLIMECLRRNDKFASPGPAQRLSRIEESLRRFAQLHDYLGLPGVVAKQLIAWILQPTSFTLVESKRLWIAMLEAVHLLSSASHRIYRRNFPVEELPTGDLDRTVLDIARIVCHHEHLQGSRDPMADLGSYSVHPPGAFAALARTVEECKSTRELQVV